MIKNKILSNAAWIIGCKILQAILGLVVTMLSARYLGPSGYGLINYAASIVAFVTPIMQLGLNSTLVQEIIHDPEGEGEIIGTALVMSLVSSVACIIGVIAFAGITSRGETDTVIVCALYSLLLIFQAIELVQYWFQAKLLSKYTSVVMLCAYVMVSAYKIVLLMTGSSIYWFAVSQALDYCIIAAALMVIYKRLGGLRFSFSFSRAGEMFARSKYYIVSSLMVTIFAQTDRIMLKMMIDDAAVGYYSAAITCAGMTGFVFAAIIDSARPSILEKKKGNDQIGFEQGMTLLYSVVIYLALAQSVVVTLFSGLIVKILYGAAYAATIPALRIVVWYTTFSYLGGARTVWILAEGKQKVLWAINLSAAIGNIVLNWVLIPIWGIDGAAVASFATQIFANVIMGYIMREIRPNNALMVRALNPVTLLGAIRDIIKPRGGNDGTKG